MKPGEPEELYQLFSKPDGSGIQLQ